MREVCFPKALHRGENRGLCKRNRSISSCLKWINMKTAVQKNVVHLSPRVCDGDLGGWRRYCNVNPFPSCYFRYCLLQI